MKTYFPLQYTQENVSGVCCVLPHSINSISFSSCNTMVYWLLLFSGNFLFWYEFSLRREYFNSFDDRNKISHWESRWKYISCSAAGSQDNDSSIPPTDHWILAVQKRYYFNPTLHRYPLSVSPSQQQSQYCVSYSRVFRKQS